MTTKKVAIIANGPVEDYDALRLAVKGYDFYVAIDGGLKHYKL